MNSLIHLHCHSTFSFLDGYGTPEQIAARVKELGHTACALTDHGNVIAHVPWQQAARDAGLKPIFGCEFYIVDDMRERTKVNPSLGASGAPHVTVIARTQEGYRNLLRLTRLSYEDGFYYKPRIDWAELVKHQEGLIVLSGCVGGYPTQLALTKGPEAARDFIADLARKIEHYYVELIPEPGFDKSHATLGVLVDIATELRIPLVMTADAHFPRPEDHSVQDLMLSVGIGKRVDDPQRELRLPGYQYCCDGVELLQRARDTCGRVPDAVYQQAIDNSGILAADCEVEIPQAARVVFAGLAPGETSDSLLWQWIREGAAQRKAAGQLPPEREAEYQQRAAREYRVLREKGFCDYVLAVADVCRYMRGLNSLVMCRGSAGGCLILWLVGASETDPVLHDLSFERFYDAYRPDPPDIDVDFEQAYRQQAIDYIYNTYGRSNCAQIAALSKLKAKSALQDACRGLGISRTEFAPLSSALDAQDEDMDRQLEDVTDPRALAVLSKYPALEHYIRRMIGQYRQSSIHAAGVLVSSHPLNEVVGVIRGADGQSVAAVDKKGAAKLGFLKMDFLSVKSLDVIAQTVRKLGKPMSYLYTLPLDDRQALEIGNAGYLSGVFQLDGSAAARVSAQIGINHFDDIPAAGALCRPGPSDWVETYQLHKTQSQRFETYLNSMHPIAAAIVQPTFGILVYQEQVMALARELAGLDEPSVNKLRKGISDKLGLNPNTGAEWTAEWSQKFVGGCVARGVDQEEAIGWWKAMQSHGGYSFNKAHCYTYGIIGYWMLYLKAHHPAEFYEAYLQLEEKDISIKRLIVEFRGLGGQVRLLDPTHLGETFTSPAPGVLSGGLTQLKGIGKVTAAKVIAKAPFANWDQLLAAIGAANARKLKETGVTTGEWDVQALINLAPWFPIPATGAAEAGLRDQFGLLKTEDLPHGESIDGDVTLAGYLTSSSIDQDKLIFAVEDERGLIVARVPYRLVRDVGPKFKALEVSDYVAIHGWWTGDVLYCKDVEVLKRYQKPEPKSKSKANAELKEGLLAKMETSQDVTS